jgi:hypothetical protein
LWLLQWVVKVIEIQLIKFSLKQVMQTNSEMQRPPLKLNIVEPLLSGLMTGFRWPDNKKSRIIEDDLLMPLYIYVKIIWRITSYRTIIYFKKEYR